MTYIQEHVHMDHSRFKDSTSLSNTHQWMESYLFIIITAIESLEGLIIFVLYI